MPDLILEVVRVPVELEIVRPTTVLGVVGGRGAIGPQGPQGIQGLPGTIDYTLLEPTEAIDAGNFVNIYEVAGVARIRKATMNVNLPAHGFTKAAGPIGVPTEVFFFGENIFLSGLVPGREYWLGSGGGVQATPPTGTGQVMQKLGVAVSPTSLRLERNPPIIVA